VVRSGSKQTSEARKNKVRVGSDLMYLSQRKAFRRQMPAMESDQRSRECSLHTRDLTRDAVNRDRIQCSLIPESSLR
jgi:hypothetical protein